MHRTSFSLALLLSLVAALVARAGAQEQILHCLFSATSAAPGLSGWAEMRLDASSGKVNVSVSLDGVPGADGSRGLHVHQWGDISDAVNASAAGGHLNPTNASHACPPTATRHQGDMGNWAVTGGSLHASQLLDLLALQGASSVVGRALVLHSATDDCVTQPTGASGARLAQCVLGLANPSARNLSANAAAAPPAGVVSAARCTFQPTGDAPSGAGGSLWVTPGPSGGIRVTAWLTGLTGAHGIHVHQWGELLPGNASRCGSHLNPGNASHGLPPQWPRHLGDLGSVQQADSNGTLWYDYNTTSDVTLEGFLGRAVIVHALVDHGAGAGCDQTGGSGTRLLMCVLGAAPAATTPPTPPVAIVNNWSDQACATPTPTPTNTTTSDSVAKHMSLIMAVIVFAVLLLL